MSGLGALSNGEYILTVLMGSACIVEKKQTPWPLVRKRTIPTERPPLVGEIQCQILWMEGCRLVSSGGSLTAVNLSFLDRSRHFSFKQLLIYPHKG
jgi:hypothetical protein